MHTYAFVLAILAVVAIALGLWRGTITVRVTLGIVPLLVLVLLVKGDGAPAALVGALRAMLGLE